MCNNLNCNMCDNLNYSDAMSKDILSSKIHCNLMGLEVGEEKMIYGYKVKHTENDMYIVNNLKEPLYFYQAYNLIETSVIQ